MMALKTKQNKIDWIIDLASWLFFVKRKDLIGHRRIERIVLARQVVMYILWNSTNYTLSEIGRALGGRTPATVSHGYQRIVNEMKRNEWLKELVEAIK